MWYFRTFGFKFFTAASVYCSVHSMGSDSKIQQWNYNWDKSHGIHDNSKSGLKPDTLNVVKHQQPYHKLIIFIRHGQYHLNRKKSAEKVLTDIGWRQAYAAGCRLREMGIKVDRIIHSDLIRARQTTAAVLIGLQNNVDDLFDSPEIVQLVIPYSSELDDPKSCPVTQKSNEKSTISEPKSSTPVKMTMIDNPYTPYANAMFDCQLSRYLTEGPPPVAPVPPTSSTKKSDPIRSIEGIRIDKGYEIHLHCKPITKQGIIAYNGLFHCSLNCCSILNNNHTNHHNHHHIIQCHCPCHRIIHNEPIETILFIGHANVFRYWICKLLQLPLEGWLRLSLGHGSISILLINNNELIINNNNNNGDKEKDIKQSKYGSIVTLNCLGDVGHLPPELLTY
uniref:Serine/threonine-protein phosphatase PGAM5, mitochondrial n=2 Tax=Schistosoma mansoni TaxID=6183 RepID=A0A3Q0KM28_SCHMA